MDPASSCNLCSVQPVTLLSARGGLDALDDASKHRLFHAHCRHCATAVPEPSLELCEQCRHSRLRHLLLCRNSHRHVPHGELVIGIDPFHATKSACRFCRYVARCLEDHCRYTKNHIDLMRRAGSFSLALPEADGDSCRLGPMNKYLYIRPDSSVPGPQPSSCHSRLNLVLDHYVRWTFLSDCISAIACTPTGENNPLPYLNVPLQDMRVIHVVQSRIVHLPEGAGFAALSYVWGNEPAGQFQTLRANICSLNLSGSLDNVSLPRTITDAIIVCKKLRQPYLWVDRLCIIQDESWEIKSVQLNQMGAIYRQADFTIVGLAGDGATYGLPGVSKPRLDVQKKLKTSGIEMVESTPSLATCLDQSIWQTRGWTHQESEASTAMVYFTDYGVYCRSRQGEVADVRAEGPAQISINFMDEACYLERVEAYTKRNLTYHCDILRAFTGLLYGMYGQNTVFGLPWTDFDRAILWESTDYIKGPRESDESSIFPTWSWISSFGHIHFRDATPRGCSVAYWGRVTTGSTGTELKIAVPDKTDGSMFSRNNQPFQTQIGIALAWLNGCIRTKAPKFVQADSSYWELHDRLADAWPEYTAYWQSAFSGYEKSEIFSNVDIRLATSPGRIMVHTQLSAFRLDWLCEEDDSTGNRLGRNAFLLRSNNGMVAGGIYLDRDSAKTFNSSLKPEAPFLALSTSQYPGTALMSDMLGEHSAHVPLSTLYGCRCTNSSTAALHHVPGCPEGPGFSDRLNFQPWPLRPRRGKYKSQNQILALSKHLAELSYFSPGGRLLHQWDDVPSLNIMMVSKAGDNDEDLYRRVGIGRVYLKRWVESQPLFRTVVIG